MTARLEVDVALALCWRAGTLVVTRRLPGAHLGGLWEFPGGKLAPGETPEVCALRELAEETGIVARASARRPAISWEYAERRVTLHPVDCDWVEGDGAAHAAAELRWVSPTELASLEFPPANAELVRNPYRAAQASTIYLGMDRAEEFEAAKARVEKLARTPTSEELLELYSLYKQATLGDVQGSRPGMLDFKGRAKYDAWATRKGLTKDVAQQAYVELVTRLSEKYG